MRRSLPRSPAALSAVAPAARVPRGGPAHPRSAAPRAVATLAALAVCALAAAACDRAPPADGLREWTPADHDRAEEQQTRPSNAATAPAPKGGGAEGADGGSRNGALVEVTWQQNCAVCHGPIGKGDGPNGPLLKTADLTREDWQAKVTDDEIAAVIKNGKGQMPRFDLPEPVLKGIIARIRALKGQ